MPSTVILDADISQIPLQSTAPLLPFSIVCGNLFIIFWWQIAGAKWHFNIKEDCFEADVTLPALQNNFKSIVVMEQSSILAKLFTSGSLKCQKLFFLCQIGL